MQIERGTRLGPYEIVAPIGAGGMGEVWKATDSRLERSVAIKILPASFAGNAQLRLRFEREAKTISQLNHPNICTLHDVGESNGVNYLVMELLDGESLADRLMRGPLPLPEVLRIGEEIAEALDRAHRQGVVHRDLKPGNIMLTKSGAKLLDFGLSKSIPAIAHDDATQHKPLTEEGTVLGTYQYMAPEQVAGEAADHRSDIFALGVVLYEMATGQRAFQGKNRTSLFAAIVGGAPRPLHALQPMTPPAFERLVERCLEKDPDDRWQSAHDIAADLRWIRSAGSQAGVAAPVMQRRKNRERLAWGINVVTALVAVAATWAFVQWRRETPPAMEASISVPAGMRTAVNSGAAISPDGTQIVAALEDEQGVRSLWLRPIGSGTLRKLNGTNNALFPFWSPDSSRIGFFIGGKLMTIDAAGTQLITVCDASGPRGGAWSPKGGSSGTIVFAPTLDGPLMQVDANGGVPTPATEIQQGERGQRWPWFLEDGERFLYLSLQAPGRTRGIFCGSIKDPHMRTQVLAGSFGSMAVADGFLLYPRGNALAAQKFNSRTATVSGPATPVVDNVAMTDRLLTLFSVARNGTMIVQRGSGFVNSQLIWVDRKGHEQGNVTDHDLLFSPRLSHDGRHLAVDRSSPADGQGDIWIYDLGRDVPSRLTFNPDNESGPEWSPDDRTVYYHHGAQGASSLESTGAGGTGQVVKLVDSPTEKRLTSVSADGKVLAFDALTGGGTVVDIWIYSMIERKAMPWLATPFNEHGAEFSPDGKAVAYQSDESGVNEIYVRAFPDSDRKWLITSGGGMMPAWRSDGRELYYIAPDGKMMAVALTPGDDLQLGKPEALFDAKVRVHPIRQYDIAPDGSRFLLNRMEDVAVQPLTLIANWTSRLPQ